MASYNANLGAREASFSKSGVKPLLYKFTEDGLDAVFLSGKYSGKKISEVWLGSAEDRDELYSKLYKTDPAVKRIIDSLCYK